MKMIVFSQQQRLSAFLFSFLFCLLLPFSLRGQSLSWERLGNWTPHEFTSFFARGDDMAVIYHDSIFYTTSDRGKVWNRQNFAPRTSIPGLVRYGRPVIFGENHLILTIDDGYNLIRSTDGGSSWQAATTISYARKSNTRLFGNGSTFYFMTYDTLGIYNVYRSDGAAKVWNEMEKTPPGIQWGAVSPDGALYLAQSVPLSSASNTTLWKGESDGAWNTVGTEGPLLYLINFGRDGNLYGSQNINRGGKIFRWSEAISGWIPVAEQTSDVNILGPAVTASGKYYAIPFDPELQTTVLHRITLQSFDIDSIPLTMTDPKDALRQSFVEEDGTVWIGFAMTGWFFSKDEGQTWNRFEVKAEVPFDRVYVRGEDRVLGLSENQAFTSTDGGKTFTEITSIRRNLYQSSRPLAADMTLFNENVLFALMSGSSQGNLYRSIDFGKTWLQYPQSPSPNIGSIIAATRGGLLFDGRNFISIDTGKTWSSIRFKRGSSTYPLSTVLTVAERDQKIYLTDGWDLIYSDDNGRTWNSILGERISDLVQVSAVTQAGTFLGGHGVIDGSTDVRSRYLRARPDGSPEWLEFPCAPFNSTYTFARGYSRDTWLATSCGLYFTEDDGVSWVHYSDIPEGTQPLSLTVTEQGRVYLSTDHGLFTTSLPSGVEEGGTRANDRAGLEIVSDPASSLPTGLVVTLAERGDVKVELYSVLGEQVRTLVEGSYEEGGYRFYWEPSSVPPEGCWLVVLRVNNSVVARKVIIQR